MKSEQLTFKRAGLVAFVVMLLLIVGTFSFSVPAKTKISKKNITIYVGQTKKLSIFKTKKKVKWKSSKNSVATVSKKGVVKAKKPGKVTITAKAGKKKYKCKVIVKKRKTKKVEPHVIVKNSIVNTIKMHGKTSSDVDGFHYYLEHTENVDDNTEYYSTVAYYPSLDKIQIAITKNDKTMVFFDIKDIRESSCYIVFYEDTTEDYGKGYLTKSLINNSSAVRFDIDTFDEDDATRNDALKQTTSFAKQALIYFDSMMSENGSTIRHKDLGFNF